MKKWGVGLIWCLALLCVGLDFFTKGWVFHSFNPPPSSYAVFPYGGYPVFKGVLGIDCTLQKVINLGGAWGVLSQFTKALVVLRIVLVLVLFVRILKGPQGRSGYAPLVFISFGALANIIDYFRFEGVVDWIHLNLWGYSFPVFNIADMMISVSVMYWVAQILWHKEGGEKRNVTT